MSDADSFIDEVTEEVRRDRLFLMLKRYGWIGGVAVALIVGGAAFNEYQQAKSRSAAEKLGDDIIAALASDDTPARAEALRQIPANTPGGAAILKMLQAGATSASGDVETAISLLGEVAANGELPLIYRHTASFKMLGLQADSLSAQDRRIQFEALAQAGAPLRLLAEEQLALIEIETGETPKAIERLQALVIDAEVTSDLKDRASQLIVALGGSL